MTSKNNYVDNEKFHEAMKEYIYECRYAEECDLERPRPSDYIGKCIMDISTNLAKKPNWSGYIFVEDMILEAINQCITYIDRYDPDTYSNPHAYFTRIVYFTFLRYIKQEKKELYGKFKHIQTSEIYSDNIVEFPITNREYMDTFIESFEEAKEQEKLKRIQKKEQENAKSDISKSKKS